MIVCSVVFVILFPWSKIVGRVHLFNEKFNALFPDFLFGFLCIGFFRGDSTRAFLL